jgi:hypothetical protein
VLRLRHALEERGWTFRLQRLERVPGHGQVQRGEHRHARRREIPVEIDAVQVHDIDRPSLESLGDGASVALLRAQLRRPVEHPRLGLDFDHVAGRRRSGAGDHDRAVSRLDQRPIEKRQHLLRAADRAGSHRRQRIGDIEDRQAHAALGRASWAEASRTNACQRGPVMPQSNCSYRSRPAFGRAAKS